MSNFIVRWLDQALAAPKPISKSLRGARGSLTLIPFPSMIEVPPAKPEPAVIDELCVCAVHDKNFMTRYVRQSDGKYLITAVLKVSAAGDSKGGSTPKPARLPIEKIVGSHPPCPWCACNANKHYHCHCGGVVCSGRAEGDLFKCRPSCGAEWKSTTYAKEIKGLPPTPERKEYRSPRTATATPTTPRAQPVLPNQLLLGPGSNVPARRSPGSVDRLGGRQ